MEKKVVLVRYHDQAGSNTRLPDSLNKVQGVLPPLGLASLAATLKDANIPVEIIDCQGSNLNKEEFEKLIKEKDPLIVGLGPMMTPAVEGIYEAAAICKKHGCMVVVGGPHLSIYPKETVMNKNIDYGINGEGDLAIVQLVTALFSGGDFRLVPGLVWKEKDEVKMNPATIVANLDDLPVPAYHLLPMQQYGSIIGHHPTLTMMVSRGCPYQCGFCYKTPSDKKTRYKSVSLVIKEMKVLIDEYGAKEIMFYDDTLTLKKDYIMELSKEIKKQGLKVHWEAPTRVNHVDEELVKEIASSGCLRLRMGVESGNEHIRKIMNKNITNEQILTAFSLCKKYGIETFAYFIMGYVEETPETMQETINFAVKLDPDFAMFTTATPLPKTDLFRRAIEKKLIDPEYWKNYTLQIDQERMPFMVKDADKWTSKAYKKFYFRPSFVLKKLWKMRDIDTFKKYWKAFKGLSDL